MSNIKKSIKYVAEMENGEFLFTMYDNTGYSAFSVEDFADANFYESPDDPILESELSKINNGEIRWDMGDKRFKRIVKVELSLIR